MPRAPALANPLALERTGVWRARRARWRGDPLSVGVLAAMVLALLAAACWLAWGVARSQGPALLAWMQLQSGPCAVLVFALALAGHERTALRLLQRARLGWLAALPGTAVATRRELARALAARSALASALLLLLPAALASGAGRSAWPATAWLLVAAAPWPAALLAALVALRRNARLLRGGLPTARARTTHPAWLPVAARWQWAAFVVDQRGRKGAWLLLPLLLALPAGMSGPATVAALFAALLSAALLTLWSAALATVPAGARLLRATPWRTRPLLAAQLQLPATLLLAVSTIAALGLAVSAGRSAMLLAVVPAAAGLLHAAVICSERLHPRRIMPVLLLHAGLQVAMLHALPPLAPLVLGVQVAHLARRALRQ